MSAPNANAANGAADAGTDADAGGGGEGKRPGAEAGGGQGAAADHRKRARTAPGAAAADGDSGEAGAGPRAAAAVAAGDAEAGPPPAAEAEAEAEAEQRRLAKNKVVLDTLGLMFGKDLVAALKDGMEKGDCRPVIPLLVASKNPHIAAATQVCCGAVWRPTVARGAASPALRPRALDAGVSPLPSLPLCTAPCASA